MSRNIDIIYLVVVLFIYNIKTLVTYQVTNFHGLSCLHQLNTSNVQTRLDLLLLSINASLFPENCRIENYIHVVRSATFHLQLKKLQKCTIKYKEVEIMEGWCLSGYDGRCQWSLS